MSRIHHIVIKSKDKFNAEQLGKIFDRLDIVCKDESLNGFIDKFVNKREISINSSPDGFYPEILDELQSSIGHEVKHICFIELSYFGNYQFFFPKHTSYQTRIEVRDEFVSDITDAMSEIYIEGEDE